MKYQPWYFIAFIKKYVISQKRINNVIMKSFSFWTFFILIWNHCLSQELMPPVLKFDGIMENWCYISKDYNFNETYKSLSNSGFTPFSHKFNSDIARKGDHIYILESTMTPSPFISNDGCLIHKLHQKTGEVSWIHHNNFMSGNRNHELYRNSKLVFDAEDNIHILGYRDIDTFKYNEPKFNYFGTPIERIIDTDGNLVNMQHGVSLQRMDENLASLENPLLVLGRQKYHCLFDLSNSQDYIEQLKCYPLSKSHDIVNDSFYTLDYPFGLPQNASFSLEYQKSIYPLGNDTLLTLTLFGTNLKDVSPENAKLSWLTLDNSGINVAHSVDISQHIFRPQDLSNSHQKIEVNTFDDYIVLSQIVSVPKTVVDAKFINWILVLDKQGNLISKPDIIYNKSKNYSNVHILRIENNKLYVSIQMDDGIVMGADILEIQLTNGTYKKVGNITTPKSDVYKIGGISKFELLDDDNALVNIPMEFLYNNERSTLKYYYSFKLQDLGFITSSDQTENYKLSFSISPNPSTDQININIPNQQVPVSLYIRDQLGETIIKQDILINTQRIDIAALAPGMYYVSVHDSRSGKMIAHTQKLVKM